MTHLGELEALQGNFTRARELCGKARAMLEDAGVEMQAHAVSSRSGPIELLAGDAQAAESQLRSDYEALSGMGDVYFASTVAALLAEALYAQGRHDEAVAFTRKAEELAPEDDIWTQAAWRSTRAKLLVEAGDSGPEALPLARHAVELLQATDAPVWRANGLYDLAAVLESCGQVNEAQSLFEQALSLYESKGASVPAERTRTRLGRIDAGSVAASVSR